MLKALKISLLVLLFSGFLTACGSSGGGNEGGDNEQSTNEETESEQDTETETEEPHISSRYSKLSADGSVLPDYAILGACVEDHETELFWEVKNLDSTSIHYAYWDYSYLTPDNSNIPESFDFGLCLNSISSSDGVYCSVQSHIDNLNAIEYCGFSDWRLPSLSELISLIKCDADNNQVSTTGCTDPTIDPTIDSDFFPDVGKYVFYSDTWSFEASADDTLSSHWVVTFESGRQVRVSSYTALGVRAVRSASIE
ncbi:MAG: DUF1566 domain-containing protein [Oleiphilus sp.]